MDSFRILFQKGSSVQHTIFCGLDFLDIQDRVSYTASHKKEVLINQFDKARGVVICSTVDPCDYYFGFPMGEYHTFDYPLYFFNVSQNAADRIQQYFAKN